MTWVATRRTSHTIKADGRSLSADLSEPHAPRGIVLFVDGGDRPHNQTMAEVLHRAGFATLLVDLLAPHEAEDRLSSRWRFDLDVLSQRVTALIGWTRRHPDVRALPLFLLGAGSGAGPALVAAAERPHDIAAVVALGGRPDLAGDTVTRVTTPTLLIVGGLDSDMVTLTYATRNRMRCETKVEAIPGTRYPFDDARALDRVAAAALDWFETHTLIAAVSER